jgi:hypothetical protein
MSGRLTGQGAGAARRARPGRPAGGAAVGHFLPGPGEEVSASALAEAVTRLVPEAERRMPSGPARAEALDTVSVW